MKDQNEAEGTVKKSKNKKGSTLDSWVNKSEKETKGRNKRTRKDEDDDTTNEKKKSKSNTPVEGSLLDTDFNVCEKTTPNGKTWNLKISSWNVAGIRAWAKVACYLLIQV